MRKNPGLLKLCGGPGRRGTEERAQKEKKERRTEKIKKYILRKAENWLDYQC